MRAATAIAALTFSGRYFSCPLGRPFLSEASHVSIGRIPPSTIECRLHDPDSAPRPHPPPVVLGLHLGHHHHHHPDISLRAFARHAPPERRHLRVRDHPSALHVALRHARRGS